MSWNAADLQKEFEQMIPFIGRNGFEIIEIDRGYVKMRAPLAENQNHFGVMYAGALFTLGELPGGAVYLTTFDTERFFPLVKNMSIDFKAPTQSDAVIEVRISESEAARIEREAGEKGKADFKLESEIKDLNGQVTAVCRGSYQLRKKRLNR